ncbi:MAG: hypothetical protein US57_C0015G0029 [Candidatus Moranbacteria bacterium GW2011_GWC2_37_73]|nr:MAG: hypothetical protein UR95_C0006G0029 [Parcubacteria group bacterium GW2011_GWC1_36_108]KKP99976.1 MAG: hypothetical protein US09_C0026G0021 [Candidatus Moranbacteria bacterium GW2011_GWD1_36_198]KKQ00077.1 MAG: hypothetical protein US10_C0042G0003 [Candidatus Moranbacteria bacterium GW2011_GWD2_36_198]KKQ39339.1 MAG: hypothetical protein US57_C0015G0029 [Candidatus Moranbacteria bacterium GW2011_GWC2_37_73]HAR99904.1 hypothetical protein [Candidatus Moranbacteria bacterium]
MANFGRVKSNIEQLEPMIAELEAAQKASPDDFSIQLKLSSLRNQINDLREQLYRENLKRDKEIIELRLIGQAANFGSIPLKFVGGITANFSSAILNTSKFIQFGGKGGKKRDEMIQSTVDLRLEGIGRGSTIFYLSGRTSADLFGFSITQEALRSTFELFQSNNSDELIDRVSSVGVESVRYISKFLYELSSDDLDIDLKWHSPDDREYLWKGRKENITRLYDSLNQMTISQPSDISFEGELVTISSKGKFEVQTIDNHRLYGQFSNDLLEKMKEFHIGDHCTGIITRTEIYNPASDKRKIEFNLKNIKLT